MTLARDKKNESEDKEKKSFSESFKEKMSTITGKRHALVEPTSYEFSPSFIYHNGLGRFHDGMAWLMQVVLFTMLGLLATPSMVWDARYIGLIVAAFLMIVARPMFDLAYFPIQMQVIDYLKAKENRSGYSYIFSHECGLYGGRLFGCGLFIVITYTISETAALIYTLPIVTFIQMMSLIMVRRITGKIASEDVIQNNTITNEAV